MYDLPLPDDKVSYKFICEQLKKIPHLQIPINIPVDEILAEYKSVKNGFDNYKNSEPLYRHWEKIWSAVVLYGVVGSHEMGGTYIRNDQTNFEMTKYGMKCPFVSQTVKEIVGQLVSRVRINNIRGKAQLGYHNHVDVDQPIEILTVQIPIVNTEQMEYPVTKKENVKDIFSVFNSVENYRKFYKPGEAWILNSWHSHNARNLGDDDKISIMVYGYLRDPHFYGLVKSLVKNYNEKLIS